MLNNFSDPQNNLNQFGLSEGMIVADFGVGGGSYTLFASKKVGEAGRVYALDVQKELLLRLKNEAKKEGLDNIEIIWADLEKSVGSKLSPESVDAVILTNILFQVEDKDGFIAEAVRVLKKKGRILLVDWADSFGNLGPRSEDIIKKDTAIELFNKVGMTYDRDISAGEHHWGVVLKKS